MFAYMLTFKKKSKSTMPTILLYVKWNRIQNTESKNFVDLSLS